jgi:hypothetical protein
MFIQISFKTAKTRISLTLKKMGIASGIGARIPSREWGLQLGLEVATSEESFKTLAILESVTVIFMVPASSTLSVTLSVSRSTLATVP